MCEVMAELVDERHDDFLRQLAVLAAHQGVSVDALAHEEYQVQVLCSQGLGERTKYSNLSKKPLAEKSFF